MRPAILLLALSACDTSTDYSAGRGEAVQVRGATFKSGELPVDDGAAAPTIVSASGKSYIVTQGIGNIGYSGLATPEAYSVAVAATDISDGYWVMPVQGADVTQEDALIFKVTLDFLPEVPYGLQTLRFVAFDEAGHPGPEYDSSICVLPDYSENNLAACSDEVTPQNAVISLRWDTLVDLDLVVVTPGGKVVRYDAPTTGEVEGSEVPKEVVKDATTGRLSRDSNADCAIDSMNLESLIFPGEPPAGDYKVYADLHDPCGESYVNFSLAEYVRTDADDGTHPVETTLLGGGELVADQADGGDGLGTFLTTVTLP